MRYMKFRREHDGCDGPDEHVPPWPERRRFVGKHVRHRNMFITVERVMRISRDGVLIASVGIEAHDGKPAEIRQPGPRRRWRFESWDQFLRDYRVIEPPADA